MAQIDFAVAFVVVFMMVSYAIFFVSNSLTQDFEYFKNKELEASANSLSESLFGSKNINSLMTMLNATKIVFKEIGGYSHTESINITIEAVDSLHVYDSTMDEIEAKVIEDGVGFELGFTPNMESYVTMVYSGAAANISYDNNITANNITAVVLSQSHVNVLSKEKCSNLQSLSYNDVRNNLGIAHRFRIDNYCVYGEEPPEAGNILVKSVPVVIENTNGSIESSYVILKVW
ncbi:MAG: hypothetical protein JW700_00340 [Candidatus Aenigmarchaeota archaeon]|nr:hypothetical protein [Candidatus Aenigmarchaeota archaeon]